MEFRSGAFGSPNSGGFELLHRTLERVMADLSGLTAAVTALVETQSTVIAKLSELYAAVTAAEANSVPQAELDALAAQVSGVNSSLAAAVAPPAAPAPAPAA